MKKIILLIAVINFNFIIDAKAGIQPGAPNSAGGQDTYVNNQMKKNQEDINKKAAQTQYNNSLPSVTQSYAKDRASHSSQVNLMGQDLSNDDLAKYNLQGAGLLGVVISDSTKSTQGANLSYADLRYSCLVGANFSNGLFNGVDLSYAYVSWGIFTKANFSKADLTGAHLEGADLTGAIFTDAIVSRATYDQYTKLPQSLTDNSNQLATMIKVTT